MITLIGLIVIGAGIWELKNNRKIARRFDSQTDEFRSTSRQNVMGIGLIIIAFGLALISISYL